MVKKAIVLAAGLGTRLRPLTCAVPKPLLPVWGEPILAHVVRMLRDWGVDDIVVNCHYLHEQVEAWCRANGCRASYEPEILGTGGVLNPLRDWIGGEDFYLVNGDIVVEGAVPPDDAACRPRLRGDGDPHVIGTCLVTEEGPRTIEIAPDLGYVTNWKSDDAGYSGTYTYCGIARLKADILRYVEPTGFSSIVQAYERAMMDGRFMKSIQPKDMLWTDAGTVERYIDLNRAGNDNAFADIPQLRALGVENCEFLGARGSERVFFRTDEGVVVLYDDANRAENALYAPLARYLLGKGVRVPKVLVDRPDLKATVYEYGGAEKKMTLEDYVKVVEALAKFNALGAEKDLPKMTAPFDDAQWARERGLFERYCLGEMFQRGMTDEVRHELENVAALLEKEPKALVHRDFQSTNVLWKTGKLCFIDFQGMRLGPAAYDLASLLYDPYVAPLSEGERRALVKLYAKKSGREAIAKIVPYAAVERLCQCLGAYGRLRSVGQPQFMKFVVPALQNLLAAADEAGLDAVGALAEDLIAAATPRRHHHDDEDGECCCGHHHHGEREG